MSDPWPGWEECGECSGSNCQHDGNHADRDCEPCPDCAHGYVPPAHQAEAAAEGAYVRTMEISLPDWEDWPSHYADMWRETARAALIAAARKEQG